MPSPGRLAADLISKLHALDLGGRRVALVGYPSHDNIGDHAIWCGQIEALRQLHCDVAYSADTQEYSPGVLRRRLGDSGAIVFQGGGNFGDLWPEHHELRLRVLDEFGDRLIVQMPQTLHFTSAATLERTRTAIAACSAFHLLCRDERSLAIARDDLHARGELAPDAAFALTAPPEAPATVDVLWLRRLDDERVGDALAGPADALAHACVRTIDWRDVDVPGPARGRMSQASLRRNELRATRVTRRPAFGDLAQPLLRRLHDSASQREVAAGLDEITRSRVVITDRLHAHILATLAGVPNVVVDTGYGKLTTFIETFTADLPTTHIVGSAHEAANLAGSLLTSGDRAPAS